MSAILHIPNPLIECASLGIKPPEAFMMTLLLRRAGTSLTFEAPIPSFAGTYFSTPTVKSHLKKLERKGLIKIERRPPKPTLFDLTPFWQKCESVDPTVTFEKYVTLMNDQELEAQALKLWGLGN